jgi:glycogen synthase
MHIVLVNRWYPPYTGFGGVAMYQYYLAHALAAQGHKVTVVAARWSKDVPIVHEDGKVKVVRLLAKEWSRLKHLPVVGRQTRSLQQHLYSRDVSRALRAMQGIDRPDVVEFAEINAEAYHYLHRSDRRPVVIRCHTPTAVLREHYLHSEMSYSTAWLERNEEYCIRKADLLTAPSHDMANVISRKYSLPAARFHVVPNPIDVSSFIRSEPEKSGMSATSDIWVLHVGRMERVKGVEVLAQAIPLILSAAPQCRFAFIGDDLKRPDGRSWQGVLQDLFIQNGAMGRVSFLGNVDQQALLEWYARADIAVVPTLNYESFSYTCAQAMASAVPVVATCMGGIPETLGNGSCGLLVLPGDPAALAQAIIKLAGDRVLRKRLGSAGRERVEKLYSAEMVADQMSRIYESVRSL